MSAGGRTDGNAERLEAAKTKTVAPSGTERHQDQTLDHVPDHETKNNFGPVYCARELLEAVAAGEERSVELAAELVKAVLADATVKRALALEELLKTRSPFALVRAVELAEVCIQSRGTGGARRSG